MAVEGKTILQTTERTELTGERRHPVSGGCAERACAAGESPAFCHGRAV